MTWFLNMVRFARWAHFSGRCISFFQPSFFIKISWFWKNVYFLLFLCVFPSFFKNHLKWGKTIFFYVYFLLFLCVFPSFFQKYVFPSLILLFLYKTGLQISIFDRNGAKSLLMFCGVISILTNRVVLKKLRTHWSHENCRFARKSCKCSSKH